MFIGLILIVLFLSADFVLSAELSLIEEPAVAMQEQDIPIIKAQDAAEESKLPLGDLSQMEQFIKDENDRFKQIKLLSLDLEKAGLELKKREIERKIEDLDRTEASGNPAASKSDLSYRPAVVLTGVFKTGSYKKAALTIDGRHYLLKESEEVLGVVLKTIHGASVAVQYGDGQIQEIGL